MTFFGRLFGTEKSSRPLYLSNTLSSKKELFKPLSPGKVSMYHCGPTVYNFAHIGNLRAFLLGDILRRTLEASGYEVRQVMNITDVGHLVSDADTGEDKMEKGAVREGKSARDIANFYTDAFFKDLEALNFKTTDTRFPRATDYIKEQIALIKTLEEKGFTYTTTDGIYFDTSRFPRYGALGNINLHGMEEGARIGINVEKRNATDFALWKFSPKETRRQQEWDSPWGVGFPGWHIECSAMSMKLLGETFDIHTGGIDHIPVHHNDEIAQSESATEKPYARYWLHNAFINTEGEKMAKSEGNFLRLQSLTERGISPLAFRYYILNAHYKSPVTFNWEAVQGAENALQGIYREAAKWERSGTENQKLLEKFYEAVNNDLNTPQGLAVVFELIKSNLREKDKWATLLKIDEVLGLNIENESSVYRIEELPQEIEELLRDREKARMEKNWGSADQLREEIATKGFLVKDTNEGQKIEKR